MLFVFSSRQRCSLGTMKVRLGVINCFAAVVVTARTVTAVTIGMCVV
jgi:hypothetical protein